MQLSVKQNIYCWFVTFILFWRSTKHECLFTSDFEKNCEYVNEARKFCEEAFTTVLRCVLFIIDIECVQTTLKIAHFSKQYVDR